MLLCLSCVLCLMAHNAVYDDKSRNPKRERSAMIGQLLLRDSDFCKRSLVSILCFSLSCMIKQDILRSHLGLLQNCEGYLYFLAFYGLSD